jgi:hypothetical protein
MNKNQLRLIFFSFLLFDTVVTNSGLNNIDMRLGDRNRDFSDQLIYSIGSDSVPSSLATGDFNDDH